MIIKQLLDEDFVNYKKPSMFIGFPNCNWKCERECGMRVCQNGALAQAPSIDIPTRALVERYMDNPITQAVVCGGLEPLDSWDELQCFIMYFRYYSPDDIVIYTGYTEEEIKDKLKWLELYEPIVVKFGRYVPNQEPHYDTVLGVKLASENQYARRLGMRITTNSDLDLVADIRSKLKENGGYCPCSLVKNDSTKCMCKEFRDQIERGEPGECHCGLYVASND